MEYVTLNNRLTMPNLGFGVYLVPDFEECKKSVLEALKVGYRLIDTAAVYMNERAVGAAISESDVARKDIFLTTKLWPQDYPYEKAKAAIDKALEKLNVEYIDLLLLHQPFGDILGAWKAMEEAVEEGKLKAIGLSNFGIEKAQLIINHAKIIPAVNQVECHPYYQETELKEYLDQYGIKLEAWYPIGHGSKELLNETVFSELSDKYRKSNVQIILRWHLQDGNIAIPKSTNPNHIKSNFDIFDFILTEEEMVAIRAVDKMERFFNMPEEQQEKRFLSYTFEL